MNMACLVALELGPDRLELLLAREEWLDRGLRLDRRARSMGPSLNQRGRKQRYRQATRFTNNSKSPSNSKLPSNSNLDTTFLKNVDQDASAAQQSQATHKKLMVARGQHRERFQSFT